MASIYISFYITPLQGNYSETLPAQARPKRRVCVRDEFPQWRKVISGVPQDIFTTILRDHLLRSSSLKRVLLHHVTVQNERGLNGYGDHQLARGQFLR